MPYLISFNTNFDKMHLQLTVTPLSVSTTLNVLQFAHLHTGDETIHTIQMLTNGNCTALPCCNMHSYQRKTIPNFSEKKSQYFRLSDC